jgi:hypothetical protein
MIVRPWVTFDSDLPYDGIETEDGDDFIQWPAKNVAEAIAEILGRLGCTDVEIDVLDHRGYEVTFNVGKRQFGSRVTMIEQYLVGFRQYSWWDGVMKRLRPEYLDILRRVDDELKRDGRFHKLRWFAGDEVLKPGIEGALSPLEA